MRSLVFGERRSPRDIIRIQVKEARLRVKRLAAPFGSSVESRKDNRLFLKPEGDELSLAAKGPELLHRPFVRLRGAVREHTLGQNLAAVRRRLRGQNLSL